MEKLYLWLISIVGLGFGIKLGIKLSNSMEKLYLWLISIAGLGFGIKLGHRFLYYAVTMGKGSESESESVETCSA